ncbi:hypothetical protein NDU88_001235 [Pleurodeles waltl]|uniref:Uncharacterized protein n=1 Tax=Pleurodeles waltl TaxID=8319 RepID=A0AAV7UTI4_PLEWA|nr:hypothetical protein NDU88_001235 [Pleurodeles waltl]
MGGTPPQETLGERQHKHSNGMWWTSVQGGHGAIQEEVEEPTPLRLPAASGPNPGPRLQVLTSLGATYCPSSVYRRVHPDTPCLNGPPRQGPSCVPAAAPSPHQNLLYNCADLPTVVHGDRPEEAGNRLDPGVALAGNGSDCNHSNMAAIIEQLEMEVTPLAQLLKRNHVGMMSPDEQAEGDEREEDDVGKRVIAYG